MDCRSDTESDLSCSGSPKRHTGLTEIRESAIEGVEFSLQAIQEAIQKFRDREPVEILQDSSYLLAVQNASELLLQFLNQIPRLLGTPQASQALRLFAELGKYSYQQLLFNFRKYLRIAAYKERAASTTMLVTWTDVLIAKLSTLAVPLAAGSMAFAEQEPKWLQLKRGEDTLRAATQLPDNWASIVAVIGSNTFSPAAMRLAASLAFIAHVMAPQISSERTKEDNSTVLEILQTSYIAINKVSCVVDSVSHSDKVQLAMLISLFAAMYFQYVNPAEMTCVAQLRPEGFGRILDSIHIIMGRSECFFILEGLDPPQCILLRWGNVVPWSWSTWDDHRIANIETVRPLSATWLYLIDVPVYGPQHKSLHHMVFGINLRRVLLNDPFSSSFMILLLQEVGKDQSLPSHITSNVLTKLSWAVVQYMETYTLFEIPRFECRISGFCEALLLLFHVVEPNQEAYSFIVEALALAPSAIFSAVVHTICQVKDTQFMTNLEGVIRCCATALSDRPRSNEHSRKCIRSARSLLDFLSILLLRSPAEHPILRGCLSSFLIQISQLLLSTNVHGFSPCGSILDSFLTTLAICCIREFSLKIGDEAIWLLSMGIMHGSRLRTAAAFSSFLLSTSKHQRQLLLKHEAWNYLLDILTLIIEKQCPAEEESLALLVSPNVCYALSSVVSSSGLANNYLLSSPWTLTARLSLQEVLADKLPADPYFMVLRDRLQKAGTGLLNALNTTQPAKEVDDVVTRLSARLVYYRDHSESGLVTVYD